MASPIDHAWALLKALPEQQMFVNPSPRYNLDEPEAEHYELPEIDARGARSVGTMHPAIRGMLQRFQDERMADYGPAGKFKPDMVESDEREHIRGFGTGPRLNELLAIRERENAPLGERSPQDSDMYLEHRASGRTPYTGGEEGSILNREGTTHHFTHPTREYNEYMMDQYGFRGEDPHADSQSLRLQG